MTKFEQFYREALRDLKKLIQRFPLAMLAAVASVVLGIIGIEIEQSGKEVPLGLMYTLMSLVLTFPMFVLAELISESLNWDVTKKYLLKLVPILIGVVYFFSLMLPYQEISERQGIEFFLLNVIFYFLILVAPFINNNFRSKLWNFSKQIIIRLFFSVLFTGVIFAGVSLAITAVQYLFELKIDNEIFIEIWISAVGLFGINFLLAGVPTLKEMNDEIDYPKLLKVCVQYILLPLLAVYGIILYVYTLRIIFTSAWPKEGVVQWVMVYGIGGFVTFALAKPLTMHVKLLKKIFTGFFISVLPLLIVYFSAIGIRISEYGVTVDRYLVVLFGLWLIPVTFYYLLSRKKHLHWLIGSVVICVLIFLYGPWNGYNISFNSQVQRLENLLIKNNLLIDGKLQKAPDNFSISEYTEIESISRYLYRSYEVEKINKWLGEENVELINKNILQKNGKTYYAHSRAFLQAINLIKIDSVIDKPAILFSYQPESDVFPVATYDYVYLFQGLSDDAVRFPEKFYRDTISTSLTTNELLIMKNSNILIEINLTDIAYKLIKKSTPYNIPIDDMIIYASNEKIEIKLLLSNLQFSLDNERPLIKTVSGLVAFSLK